MDMMTQNLSSKKKRWDCITRPHYKNYSANQIFGTMQHGFRLEEWPEECHEEVNRLLDEYDRRAEEWAKTTRAQRDEKFRKAIEIANSEKLVDDSTEKPRGSTPNNKEL